MTEVNISGNTYSIRKLPLIQQFHISRKLIPYILTGSKEDFKLSVLGALSRMGESESEFIVNAALAVTQRKQDVLWSPIGTLKAPQFDDASVMDYFDIAAEVVVDSLSSFFSALISRMEEKAPSPESAS